MTGTTAPMIEIAIKGLTIISTIIATLRAGSRAIYISDHHAIGLVDGPTIQSSSSSSSNSNSNNSYSNNNSSNSNTNSNSTNNFNPALFEISENFKHCVKMSSIPSSSSKSKSNPYKNVAENKILKTINDDDDDFDGAETNSDVTAGSSSSSVSSSLLLTTKASPVLQTLRQRYYHRIKTNVAAAAAASTTWTKKKNQNRNQKQQQQQHQDERRRKRTKKVVINNNNNNIFDEQPYSLGYTHYTPKTFSNSNSWRQQQQHEKEDEKEIIKIGNDSNSNWDYESAIEGEYFYDVATTTMVSTPSSSVTTTTTAAVAAVTATATTESDNNDDNRILRHRRQRRRHRHRRMVQLTSYCPRIFQDLRNTIFGVTEQHYLQSIVGHQNNLLSFASNSKGSIRSGGYFFFTKDGAYLIKTIPQREKHTLLQMLPNYYEHMKKYQNKSLLTKFFGMYSIKIYQEEKVYIDTDNDNATNDAIDTKDSHTPVIESNTNTDTEKNEDYLFAPTEKEYTFVVMNAVFPPESDQFISERYDLKGSTVGRKVSQEELEKQNHNTNRRSTSKIVWKDLDLLVHNYSHSNNKRKEQGNRRKKSTNVFSQWLKNLGNWIENKNTNSNTNNTHNNSVDGSGGFTFGATAKAAVLSQLRKDVQFLRECHVMDYSLLVGIVRKDHTNVDHDHDANSSSSSSSSNNNSNDDNSNSIESSAESIETIVARQNKIIAQCDDTASTKQEEHNPILERLEGSKLVSNNSDRHYRPRHNHDRDSVLRFVNFEKVFHTCTKPVRILLSPTYWMIKKIHDITRISVLDTIVTYPMPYYGSDQCVIDGGKYSVLHGYRHDHRAVYYIGLIDFLQPWTTRKVIEQKLKGLAGYDTDAISAVPPDEYAKRFLLFLDQNIQ